MSAKSSTQNKTLYAWSLLRIALGSVFLWAFLDKLFGLGFATCRDKMTEAITTLCSQSWAAGGSPTSGFLKNAVQGPFADFYHNLSGVAVVDWLFMMGLFVAGVGLLLGVWLRVAALVGIVMMLLMYTALLWPANNPLIDEHIIYSLALAGIFFSANNQAWSLQSWWGRQALAKRFPLLK